MHKFTISKRENVRSSIQQYLFNKGRSRRMYKMNEDADWLGGEDSLTEAFHPDSSLLFVATQPQNVKVIRKENAPCLGAGEARFICANNRLLYCLQLEHFNFKKFNHQETKRAPSKETGQRENYQEKQNECHLSKNNALCAIQSKMQQHYIPCAWSHLPCYISLSTIQWITRLKSYVPTPMEVTSMIYTKIKNAITSEWLKRLLINQHWTRNVIVDNSL